MEVIPEHVRLLAYLFLIAYMLSVGLETTRGEIMAKLRDSKLTAYALLANLVLVPIIGLLLTRVTDLPPDIRTGLLLLCIAPGGLFALQFARVSKSDVHLAVALLFLLSLVGIVVTPILAHFVFNTGGNLGLMFRLIVLLVLLLLLPVYAGSVLSSQQPADHPAGQDKKDDEDDTFGPHGSHRGPLDSRG